nr:SH3 domain-containing C40 family peptidase [Paenibacillus antri]
MRTQPSLSGKVIRMLNRGEDIHVLGEASGNWLKIQTKSGTTGYISDNEKYTDYDRYSTEVSSGVNMRTQPSTSSKIIRMLNRGEDIRVLAESGDYWLKVQTKGGTVGYISSNEKYTDYEGGAGTGSSTSSASQSAIVKTAKSYKGDFDYKWGAEPWNTNNKYADCSSYMQLIFRKHDIELPRTSRQQAKEGTYVKKSNLKPGDLVFFDTNDNGSINHVGLYIGGGDFIHASPIFDGVGISDINSNYWSDHYVTARNVL